MMTRRNAWNRVQPSTSAASSSSFGMLTKNERSIQIVNGWLIATSTKISVKYVLRIPSASKMVKNDGSRLEWGMARNTSATSSSQKPSEPR